MSSKPVALVTGSTQAARIGPSVAGYVKNVIEQPLASARTSPTSIDAVMFNLPVNDEAVAPAMVPRRRHSAYNFKSRLFPILEYEHSKAWSAEIVKYDGYVLVISEYNYWMAGGTKNAIDYLLNDWKGLRTSDYSSNYLGRLNIDSRYCDKGALPGCGLVVTETRPTLFFAKGVRYGLFAAIGEGKLGADTLKSWEQGKTETSLKAATELKGFIAAAEYYSYCPKTTIRYCNLREPAPSSLVPVLQAPELPVSPRSPALRVAVARSPAPDLDLATTVIEPDLPVQSRVRIRCPGSCRGRGGGAGSM
ncbi:hypothetical protein F4779DRAFT_614228 [Xylariaceae sp. FL0662B]|nr:hypothetical protein F4779DRAFT_614228 [Xylariaceae sp. FL0662B]